MVENPWSSFVVIRNRDVTFGGKQKLGNLEKWPCMITSVFCLRKLTGKNFLRRSMFYFDKFLIKEGKKNEVFYDKNARNIWSLPDRRNKYWGNRRWTL